MLFYSSRRFVSNRKHFAQYALLRVNKNASPEQIRLKYVELIKFYHPDNQQTGNFKKFIKIKEAYDSIKNAPLMVHSRQSSYSDEEIMTHEDLLQYQSRLAPYEKPRGYAYYIGPKKLFGPKFNLKDYAKPDRFDDVDF